MGSKIERLLDEAEIPHVRDGVMLGVGERVELLIERDATIRQRHKIVSANFRLLRTATETAVFMGSATTMQVEDRVVKGSFIPEQQIQHLTDVLGMFS